MAVVIATVIAGVYYVRVVQIIFFTYGGLPIMFSWLKVLYKQVIIKFRFTIPLGVAIFLILFIMVSPNWILVVAHDASMGLYI